MIWSQCNTSYIHTCMQDTHMSLHVCISARMYSMYKIISYGNIPLGPKEALLIHLTQTKISNLSIRTNIDAPEAMFDGIMQAAVCGEVVGWRNNARKLMLILTDNAYHIAGDGRVFMG